MRAFMKLNNEYDPFARIYNRHWGAEYRRRALPIVKRLLLSALQPDAEVLDVGCGTGQLTANVRRAGFAVWGIDSSEAMLAFARKNAPGCEFCLADARQFALGRRFDGAYSVFESLNHTPGVADLTRAFRNIRRHLKQGAPFLFDLNNEDAFGLYWNTVDALVEDDATCVLHMDYDEHTRIGTCRFTAFEKMDGAWRRNDFAIHQTCHKGSDVLKALAKTGFANIAVYSAADVGMKGHTGYGREFYLARAG